MASSTTITQQKKPERSLSPWQIARKKFLRNKLAMVSTVFIIIVTVISLLAPFLAPYLSPNPDITKVNISSMNIQPNGEHILGTDKSGRDVLTRLFYGGRVSLLVGFSATLMVITLGTVVGSIAGFFGGAVDSILMRFTDFVLNFPFLVFVIVLNTVLYGIVDGLWVLIMVIGVLSWGGVARLVRSKVLAEKENEYILAALSIGCSPWKVIRKHLLPNVMSTIIVQGTLIFASMIVVESALSYLGFGVPQTTPSWGNMLSSANEPDVLQGKPWIWMPPALVITLTILSINFIGEGLKDALNPKSLR
ncbi:ABC transporter permease [Planococcus liqunii]|uniref:ABC transporter permease n=1 Tax=Planococcus liqunii TaxID=3058394 RepID=A0ABT8MMU9_9BACL|nr:MULTISPECIES: oligopeptide ABC transporter permease [unclassified Planococcus (in: firmicutes)]MDN7226179.1 ABC transporter permease [Planococcus sp. N064]WKA49961.1 ABC transporter permease [Planococcus sp. N056]